MLIILLLLSVAFAVAQDECFTNFRDLTAAMTAKDTFDFKTFVVCPNTVIDIGVRSNGSDEIYVNGDVPLILRQFSRVYCGTEGSLSDNCTIKGGANQVKVNGISYNGEDKKRMIIKGFTFEDSEEAAILAVYQTGDLLIEDCVFQNHNSPGTILASPAAPGSDPEITFHRCIFRSNELGDSSITTYAGPITVSSVILTITNSVFSDNEYTSDRVVRTTRIVNASNSYYHYHDVNRERPI